ncbi:hypothetical protein DH09_07420 [Bacillaceae bacterium JMAK1]|nr:hypothetical protein DH09_07420 [Bacillaceae bacterium JMAK1]
MNQAKVHHYIERYLTTSGAQFLSQNPNDIEVQLTRELDEELMNRPFYWHYLDKTGAAPQPMQMRMTTSVDSTNGFEKVHFGSPRLHQFFSSALNKGRFTRLYEQTAPHSRTALYPWLCLNVRISYTCHRRRDELRSFGVQLINGETVDNFMDVLRKRTVQSSIPEMAFKMAGLIQPKSAVARIKQYVLKELSTTKHTWADEAVRRMEEDLKLLDRFYHDQEESDQEAYRLEQAAIKEQYQPAIELNFINGGVFYLQNS